MEIQYVYQKKRSEFGRHAQFSDRAAEIHVDIPPDIELRKSFMPRNPCSIGVQGHGFSLTFSVRSFLFSSISDKVFDLKKYSEN